MATSSLALAGVFFLPFLACASPLLTRVSPNFTASFLQFVDNGGAFLFSPNSTFRAALLLHPALNSSRFFNLGVVHSSSNTIVWSANPATPVFNSSQLLLSPSGLSVISTDDRSLAAWSTPLLPRRVSAMVLTDQGSLRLLDAGNGTLWDSFDYPTDTFLIGQRLNVGTTLRSSTSPTTLSPGNFSFSVTRDDAILQWGRQQYWSLSSDQRSFRESNMEATHLEMNQRGLYLYNGGGAVWLVNLPKSDFRIATVRPDGRLAILSWIGEWDEFVAPADRCRLPLSCGMLGLCSDGACQCPPGFQSNSSSSFSGCSPSDKSQLASADCTNSASNRNPIQASYIHLGVGSHYFADKFQQRTANVTNLPACRALCSDNCSCLGFFFSNSSAACYLLRDQLGSLYSNKQSEFSYNLGYVKAIMSSSSSTSGRKKSPIAVHFLFPCIGLAALIFLAVTIFIGWRRRRSSKVLTANLGRPNSSSSIDSDYHILIPGMPKRFRYDELQASTSNFQTEIGAGGFGIVYRGALPDETPVAVKKITNLGLQGKKEYMTEIAIIGSIRHVNLVRLHGYCAQGSQRLLVYEYMNRGSLDRLLFGSNAPVLTWPERVDIALDTARGLAYLHHDCDHKIIHCDIKPENILLHDSHVKISDFGLSKLMTREESRQLFTTMRGTRGYLAPEWITNAPISNKTDVYSYGMLLLEIVRGRKNSEIRRSSEEDEWSGYFPMFALDMHRQGRYGELADTRLEGRGVVEEEVGRLVRVALCCVQEDPAHRPSMASVVAMLEGHAAVAEPRVQSLYFLRFYQLQYMAVLGSDGGGSDANSSMEMPDSASDSYLSSQQISGPR